MPGVSMYVLDESGERVFLGAVGELYVGGWGVAEGYLGAPELTRERFVTPSSLRGERVYRTGDRARWRHDGVLVHHGRADHMLKIRGYRVEPGDVENHLLQIDGVRDAVVIPNQRHDGLVAGIVLESYAEASEIPAELSRRVPPYMIPSRICELKELPRNPNGKVDRRALVDTLTRQTEAAEEAPIDDLDPTTRAVIRIWQDLLSTRVIGLDDTFVSLGGDSIRLLRLLSALRQEFGIELEVAELFQYSTARALSDFLRHRRGEG
jgi:acyl carrier protein